MQRAQALQSILGASGGIRFGDVVQLSFDATARSAKDATSLADVLRFVASMIQTQRQNNQGADILASAFDNMVLTTNGDSMHVAISLPERSLEQLADMAPKSATRARH
jgi:polyhydroxyalkanoate synthesis regulator protein